MARGHAVVPTKGMLVPGWLLAVPQEHVLSSASLSEYRQRDLWAVVDWALTALGRQFSPATVFEHGAVVPNSSVGCGVDHAHVHIVPLEFNLAKAAWSHPLGRKLRWRKIENVQSYRWSARAPYLLLRDPTGETWLARGDIPSQFFRRIIAAEIGRPEAFDWRCDDGLPLVEETRRRLALLSLSSV
jgi:ATP adenylyltransferase